MKDSGQTRPPRVHDSLSIGATSVAAFVGIAAIGLVDRLGLPGLDPVFLVGSLGATAVILFGAPDSPMAAPRAVLVGHVVSALLGVACFRLFGASPWFSGALAVALSIAVMQRTGTLHAPGGATALIANIGPERVKALGFGYAFAPVLSGAVILVAVAFLVHRARARSSSLLARLRSGAIDAEPLDA